MKDKKTNFILFVVLFVAIVAWIAVFVWDYFRTLSVPPPPPSPADKKSEMPNPASVFCEEQGGKVEIHNYPESGEAGYCVFEDGRFCDEWVFFREGECIPPLD